MNFYDPEGTCSTTVASKSSPVCGGSRSGPAASESGPGETAEGMTERTVGAAGGADITLPLFLQVIRHRGGKSAGAIRVSFGLVE